MPSYRALLCSALLIMTMPATHSFAQAKPDLSDVPTFQTTTSLVFLDVTVLDKKGHIVTRGLTKDDFTITEDKRPQRIFSFEAPESHVPDQHFNSDVPDGDAPITIYVLDQLNSSLEDFAFIRDSMQSHLEKEHAQLAAPAELMVLGNRSLELVQGYTRNRADLLFALKHVPNALPFKLNPAFKDDRFFQSIQALQQIALQNKGISGRKNIIWIGHGGPGVNTDFLNDNSIDRIEQFVHQTTNLLVDTRISLFVVFPGLKIREISVSLSSKDSSATLGLDPFSGNINFGVFVNETGGKLFYNQNDVDSLIERSQQQGAQYYTLTYRPGDSGSPEQNDGKFRRIRVTLRDPNLQVVTKGGYYAPDAKNPFDPEKQTVLNVSEAVQSSIPYTGLALKVDSFVRHPDTRTANITVIVQSKGIVWNSSADGSSKSNLILAAVCFSSSHQILASKIQGIAFSVNSQDQAALAHQSLRTPFNIRLPSGTDNLRIAIQTEDGGRIGAVELDRQTINAAPAAPTPEPAVSARNGHTPQS